MNDSLVFFFYCHIFVFAFFLSLDFKFSMTFFVSNRTTEKLCLNWLEAQISGLIELFYLLYMYV